MTKLDKNHFKVERLQREATVFRLAQRLKKRNIPFIDVSFEYKESKDSLRAAKLYGVFELHKWAGKIVNHGVSGLPSVHYYRYTKNNTIEIAMLIS